MVARVAHVTQDHVDLAVALSLPTNYTHIRTDLRAAFRPPRLALRLALRLGVVEALGLVLVVERGRNVLDGSQASDASLGQPVNCVVYSYNSDEFIIKGRKNDDLPRSHLGVVRRLLADGLGGQGALRGALLRNGGLLVRRLLAGGLGGLLARWLERKNTFGEPQSELVN